MNRAVRLSLRARLDLERLTAFLDDVAPSAAVEAAELIREKILELGEFPEAGSPRRDGRELYVRFGAGAYVVQYRVDADAVIVARIFHSREQR